MNYFSLLEQYLKFQAIRLEINYNYIYNQFSKAFLDYMKRQKIDIVTSNTLEQYFNILTEEQKKYVLCRVFHRMSNLTSYIKEFTFLF